MSPTKLENLSPAQAALLIKTRDAWLNRVFKENAFNKDVAISGVKWLYQLANLREPLVLIMQSPAGCQFAANILGRKDVRAQVGAQVWDQVWAQVGDQVRDQVWDQVGAQVWDQVWAQVGAQVRAQVGDQVRAQVWDQVGAQVWDQVGAQKLKYFTPAWCDLWSDSGWLSFYDFFRSIDILRHDKLNKYIDFVSSGVVYTIFLDGLVILCEPPLYYKRDDFYRLHCADGPAVQWKDGYANHFWHGVPASQKLIETPEAITKEDFIREENAEVRRVYMEKLESGRFFQLLDMAVIDRNKIGNGVYAKEYTLYRTKEPDNIAGEHIQFVNVICHSTEREFMLCVPPDIANVYDAVAWTFGKSRQDYSPVVEA